MPKTFLGLTGAEVCTISKEQKVKSRAKASCLSTATGSYHVLHTFCPFCFLAWSMKIYFYFPCADYHEFSLSVPSQLYPAQTMPSQMKESLPRWENTTAFSAFRTHCHLWENCVGNGFWQGGGRQTVATNKKPASLIFHAKQPN